MKKTITAALSTILPALLGFVASPFLRGLWDFAADIGLPKLSPQQQLSLLATLSILCLLLGGGLYRCSSKRLLVRQYKVDESQRFYVHRRTGQRVCGDCLLTDGIASPLIVWPTLEKILRCARGCPMKYALKEGET
jgi:hypothetical protein